MPDMIIDAHGTRIAELADQVDKGEKAMGSLASQLDEDGRSIAGLSRRTAQLELDMQKQDFQIGKLTDGMRSIGKFKGEAKDKMAGLQRLAASAAMLAMLDLLINFLQLSGAV